MSTKPDLAAPIVAHTKDELVNLLHQYRGKVEAAMIDARSGREKLQFSNDGVDNARIVADVMLGSASNSVDVYSNKLSTEVFDAQQFRELANKGVSVRVLLDEEDAATDANSATSDLLDLIQAKQVEVRVNNLKVPNHFSVVDDAYVRFELDHSKRTAIVSFGDVKFGDNTKKLFNALWEVGKQLPAKDANGETG